MSILTATLELLRNTTTTNQAGLAADDPVAGELSSTEVGFVSPDSPLADRWHRAIAELRSCIGPLPGANAALFEGGNYPGNWLEGTGTISAEVLGRFVPTEATASFRLFATHQRPDGLLPYKVIASGPAYSQLQIVTPLARSVWNHYLLTGRDREFLATMYHAMAAYDGWLARHRDTRHTGAVEAFCTFDTGHDLSPRFWFVPDRCLDGDATRYDTTSPMLPYVAPDLTANVACQRGYLARIAAELGEDPAPWELKAAASLAALEAQCYDPSDGCYYDRASDGTLVRVQSDVLLRVLACEVGDHDAFVAALRRYLLNTAKFCAHYGFTSLAMDDPRFDHDHRRNSWGGPVNFLSLIRAPHAFDHHGHHAELALTQRPVLAAVARADRFPQCLDPWSGEAGFTSGYSPAILWYLDAIERACGVLPRPDGQVWLTGLPPTRLDHGVAADATGYRRRVAGVRYELVADDARVEVYRDGRLWLAFPTGWRVVLGADGEVAEVIGMVAGEVSGDLIEEGRRTQLRLGPNQRVNPNHPDQPRGPGFVPPHSDGSFAR